MSGIVDPLLGIDILLLLAAGGVDGPVLMQRWVEDSVYRWANFEGLSTPELPAVMVLQFTSFLCFILPCP